jgi:hypothetical protein
LIGVGRENRLAFCVALDTEVQKRVDDLVIEAFEHAVRGSDIPLSDMVKRIADALQAISFQNPHQRRESNAP